MNPFILTIRNEQLLAFRHHFNGEYATEVRDNLKQSIPHKMEGFTDEELLKEIIRLIEYFQNNGIAKKGNIHRLVYLRFMYPECLALPYPPETVYHLTYPDRSEDDKSNQLFLSVLAKYEK